MTGSWIVGRGNWEMMRTTMVIWRSQESILRGGVASKKMEKRRPIFRRRISLLRLTWLGYCRGRIFIISKKWINGAWRRRKETYSKRRKSRRMPLSIFCKKTRIIVKFSVLRLKCLTLCTVWHHRIGLGVVRVIATFTAIVRLKCRVPQVIAWLL